jgi:hypothetical protein
MEETNSSAVWLPLENSPASWRSIRAPRLPPSPADALEAAAKASRLPSAANVASRLRLEAASPLV